MSATALPRIVPSLDQAVSPGAERIFAEAREQRLLSGAAVGIIRDGEAMLRFYGDEVGPRSAFELGSLTKTYTAELLAILVERKVVRLDDPVSRFLPHRPADHEIADPVTLLDLATHCSGLPRLPPGLPLTSLDPYATYSEADLESYLAACSLELAPEKKFLYSNLGYSVLGFALGAAAGMPYAELLQREIIGPRGMSATVLALGQPQPNLLCGHFKSGLPAFHWTFQAFAPCGALCSTAGDQLTYMAWLLKDSNRPSWQPTAPAPGGEVGLGWMLRSGSDACWHNGATLGFSSYLSLDRRQRTGIVILSQTCAPQLVTTLGVKLERLLAGQPITPLKG